MEGLVYIDASKSQSDLEGTKAGMHGYIMRYYVNSIKRHVNGTITYKGEWEEV